MISVYFLNFFSHKVGGALKKELARTTGIVVQTHPDFEEYNTERIHRLQR